MKKILLTAVAAFAAVMLNAQTWTGDAKWSKTLTPVDDAKELAGTYTTVAADGSVFTTGTYNQELEFGPSFLTNDDKLTSAYLAKYQADGTEAWAVSLYGASIIHALTTDAEGNVFIAGQLADKVEFGSSDGNAKIQTGIADVTATTTGFVAKYNKDGVLLAVRTIVPVVNTDISASGMYLPLDGGVYFRPGKIMVSGDKVYLSATYAGDVKLENMIWEGRYVNVGIYTDKPGMGVLTLNAADLTGATSVVSLIAKENLAETDNSPESVCFTTDGTNVYAGFVGKGSESLITAEGSTKIDMKFPNDGNVEHAFILVKIAGGKAFHKVFHVDMHDKAFRTDRVGDMALDGEKLYVAGTYYNQLGFDLSKHPTGSADMDLSKHFTGSADMFVACVDPGTFDVDWAVTDGYDEGDATKNEEVFHAMLVNNGNVFIAGVSRTKSEKQKLGSLTYNITPKGVLSSGDNADYASLCDNGKGQVAALSNADKQTTVSVYEAVADGISVLPIGRVVNDTNVYNINGQRVIPTGKLAKGIYIIGNKKVVVK